MTFHDQNEIDRLLFKLIEDDLSPNEAERLEELMAQSPELNHEVELWNDTVVEDQPMEYPHTDDLYRKRDKRVPVMWGTLGIAATAVVGLLMFWPGGPGVNFSGPSSAPSAQLDESSVDNSAPDLSSGPSNYSSYGTQPSAADDEGGTVHSTTTHPTAQASAHSGRTFSQSNGISGIQGANMAYQQSSQVQPSVGSAGITGNTSGSMQASWISPKSGGAPTGNAIDADQGTRLTVTDLLKESENGTADITPYTNAGWKPSSVNKFGLYKLSASSREGAMDPDKPDRKMGSRRHKILLSLTNYREHLLAVPNYSTLATNPANVGALRVPKISLQTDCRWPETDQIQFTSRMAYEGYMRGIKSGFGIQMEYADLGLGAYQDVKAEIMFSPKLKVGRNATLEPGIGFTLGRSSLDPEKAAALSGVEFGNYAPTATPTEASPSNGHWEWYEDMNLGLKLNTGFMYAGIAARNILGHRQYVFSDQVNQSMKAPFEFSAIVGTDYERKGLKTFSLSPYVMYRYMRERHEAWAGINFGLKWFTTGLAANQFGECGASLGFRTKFFRMDYTFGYTQSQLQLSRNMQHSLRLNILLATPKY